MLDLGVYTIQVSCDLKTALLYLIRPNDCTAVPVDLPTISKIDKSYRYTEFGWS